MDLHSRERRFEKTLNIFLDKKLTGEIIAVVRRLQPLFFIATSFRQMNSQRHRQMNPWDVQCHVLLLLIFFPNLL